MLVVTNSAMWWLGITPKRLSWKKNLVFWRFCSYLIIFEIMFFICCFKNPSSFASFFIPSNWLAAGIINYIFIKRGVLSFRFSCLNVLLFFSTSCLCSGKISPQLLWVVLHRQRLCQVVVFPANVLWAGTWDGELWIRAPERAEVSVPRKSCLKKMVPLII